MRYLNLQIGFLSLALVISPSLGYADGVHIFSNVTCRQTIPCPTSENALGPEELAAAGNNCLATIGAGGNLNNFDTLAGLDSNDCLTPTPPDPSVSKLKLVITPHCCVVPNDQGACVFQCNLSDN